MNQDDGATQGIVGLVILCVVGLALVLGLIVGGIAGFKAFGRYQARADERNQITLNEIKIQQTAQLVQVEQQKAAIRVAEANGIAAAQQIINSTLTPLYLQHEAIQAQEMMVNSPNHSTIYIPVGTNGLPLVVPVDPGQTGK